MKKLLLRVVGMLMVLCCLKVVTFGSVVRGESVESGQILVVTVSEESLLVSADGEDRLRRLLDAAWPTIGTPYKWGGTHLKKGIDCSNYTWQLFRNLGLPYKRFLSTMVMSRLKQTNGLRSVTFKDARAGDLLVYGYRDVEKRWHGHVVILIDKDGGTTGHPGLVLGAHGKPVDSVQFITFTGFEEGYFKDPQMRLCNVLRMDVSESDLKPD